MEKGMRYGLVVKLMVFLSLKFIDLLVINVGLKFK